MDFWHDAAAQKRWLRRFILAIAVLLIPVVMLAFYARPSADDYVYAARTHAVVQQYGADWPRLLAAAWETTVYFFQNWQGLYVSGFILALQPAIFGNAWYGLTLACVLVPLFLCLYACSRLIVNRLEPAHALALAISPQEACHSWNLSVDEARAYLAGQTFPAEGEKGWYLITVDGYSLGWGKLAGSVMKNHYPKGLRKLL